MIKIILATSNKHKSAEIQAVNKYSGIIFDTVKDKFNPAETGGAFIENAVIKAKTAGKMTKSFCLADDSGLCVDFLDGRPGIYSSRYADTQQEKIEKILNELNGVKKKDRTAHFICSMVLADSSGNILHATEGRLDGYISEEPKGSNGFGYDPVFFIPEYSKTVAELSDDIKNSISHRAKALIPMLEWINQNIK